jgi:hypothetical protein
MQIVFHGSKSHLMNSKQMTRSTSSINTSPTKTSTNDNPNSVVHLVHNLNNKNDNTLKKRNALVAFEFKTLLDQVASPDTTASNNKNRQSDAFMFANSSNAQHSPPIIQTKNSIQWQQQQQQQQQQHTRLNHHHHHQHHKRNHSRQSMSSTSSTCSTASSSPSTSSSKKLDSIRAVSPSQLTSHVKFVGATNPAAAAAANTGRITGNHDYDNSNLYKPNNNNNNNKNSQNHQHAGGNLRSKSQIITNANTKSIVVSNVNNKIRFEVKSNVAGDGNLNTTIWREELNAKSNVQEQIKKQVF